MSLDVIKCEVGLEIASLNKPEIDKFINETQFLTMNYTPCQSPYYDATGEATVESSPIFVPRTSVHINLAVNIFCHGCTPYASPSTFEHLTNVRNITFPYSEITLKLSATAYLTYFPS